MLVPTLCRLREALGVDGYERQVWTAAHSMPHSPTASGERRSLRVPCDVLFVSPTCLCDRLTGHRLAIVTATVPPSGVTSPPERPRPDPDGGQTTAGRGTCPPESRERSGLCGLSGCRRWVPAATVSSNTFISEASVSWTRLIGSRCHARCYGGVGCLPQGANSGRLFQIEGTPDPRMDLLCTAGYR